MKKIYGYIFYSCTILGYVCVGNWFSKIIHHFIGNDFRIFIDFFFFVLLFYLFFEGNNYMINEYKSKKG